VRAEPEQRTDTFRGWDAPPGPDDLPDEAVRQSKLQVRLNALALLFVLLLTTLAPYPWALLAPVLLLVPLGYGVWRRFRTAVTIPTGEPFSSVPKDPEDPRRYRPIG
jgi:hypothetical protein